MSDTLTFTPTHLLDGIHVQQEKRGSRKFFDSDGGLHWASRGHKPFRLDTPDSPEEASEEAPEEAPLEEVMTMQPASFVEEGGPTEYVPTRRPESTEALEEITLVSAETAYAILRAAAWPVFGEAVGYGECIAGHSATLTGTTPEGDAIVRVCIVGRGWVTVRVPKDVEFAVL